MRCAETKLATPSSSHLPSTSGSGRSLFCHSCLANQTLIMNMLANYLPDEDVSVRQHHLRGSRTAKTERMNDAQIARTLHSHLYMLHYPPTSTRCTRATRQYAPLVNLQSIMRFAKRIIGLRWKLGVRHYRRERARRRQPYTRNHEEEEVGWRYLFGGREALAFVRLWRSALLPVYSVSEPGT